MALAMPKETQPERGLQPRFSPPVPWLKPVVMASVFAGLKPGASTIEDFFASRHHLPLPSPDTSAFVNFSTVAG